MRILVAQINPIIGDLKGNLRRVMESIEKGRKEKVDIILFPELTLTGYPPEDLLLQEEFIIQAEDLLQQLISHTKDLMVVVGLARRNSNYGEKPLFNSAAVIQDRKIVGFHDKILLPTYDVFDERRYFEPGKEIKTFVWKGARIGILICEDIWEHSSSWDTFHYGCDPVQSLKVQNIDLLLNLSASPYQFYKPEVRVKVCEAASRTLKKPVVLCAQVGGNDQLIFDGYSVATNGDGKITHLAKGFEEDWMVVDLNAQLCPCAYEHDRLKQLFGALVLGTRDYFHKQSFTKAVVGLSGGIDSALVACIAAKALGPSNVLGVALPSKYNPPESLKDARKLAQNLNIEWDEIPIQSMVDACLSQLTPHFQGKPEDVTEENIQSRLRGLTLMALSNKLGSLVLSTGNKSELAMGYCTLYGDMSGGLAVIADVTKTQVYLLAGWINRKAEVIPKEILDKAPSAELRPHQKDSDILPPYSIIDAIIQSYIEDGISCEQIAQKHCIALPVVKELVKKIHLAEYKRRQAPPLLRVSKKSFRVGRRYPIVQRWV